jgi:SPX domain protein involved in polyphosphate accumulation
MTELGREEFRYERKFLARGMDRAQTQALIMLNPGCFRTLHKPRIVNNVYFDDLDFSFFKENVEGDSRRRKVRIRWYNKAINSTAPAVLEVKTKTSQVGSKIHFPLEEFDLANLSDTKKVDEWLRSSMSLPRLIDKFGSLRPTLINRYKRSYFISFDEKFRITVDDNLEFFRPEGPMQQTCVSSWEDQSIIVELKYAIEDDTLARNISNNFPFRLSKMSKYVAGIYHIYMS